MALTLYLFLSVDVQSDLDGILFRNGNVSFRGGNDDGLSRRRRSKFLRQVHFNRQDIFFYFHLNVFHFFLLITFMMVLINRANGDIVVPNTMSVSK